MSSCLPTIIPCSCICEDTWFADRRARCCKVLCSGEPFVGEGENTGAEGFVDKIYDTYQLTALNSGLRVFAAPMLSDLNVESILSAPIEVTSFCTMCRTLSGDMIGASIFVKSL